MKEEKPEDKISKNQNKRYKKIDRAIKKYNRHSNKSKTKKIKKNK